MNRKHIALRALLFLIALLMVSIGSGRVALGQLSKFTQMREWTDQSGKYKTKAKISSVDNDWLVIELEDGTTKKLKHDVFSQSDRDLIKEYKEALFKDTDSEARDLIFTSEMLEVYQKFLKKNFISQQNREYVELRIKDLESQVTSEKSIMLPDGPVSESELGELKSLSSLIVTKWIEEADTRRSTDDPKELRDAIKLDPTSLEASVLLALFIEVNENQDKSAQRHLEDAVRRGEKYRAISNEADRANLIAAFNNLAVSNARSNRVSKAIKLWEQASLVNENKVPPVVKRNVAKLVRTVDKQGSGVSGNRSEIRSLDSLVREIDASGSKGGWEFICPFDNAGNSRENLGFMLTKFATLKEGVISDTRCVLCDGSTSLRCHNRLCKNGSIKENVWKDRILTINGRKTKVGRYIAGFKYVKCKVCSGDGMLRCRACSGGKQRD